MDELSKQDYRELYEEAEEVAFWEAQNPTLEDALKEFWSWREAFGLC